MSLSSVQGTNKTWFKCGKVDTRPWICIVKIYSSVSLFIVIFQTIRNTKSRMENGITMSGNRQTAEFPYGMSSSSPPKVRSRSHVRSATTRAHTTRFITTRLVSGACLLLLAPNAFSWTHRVESSNAYEWEKCINRGIFRLDRVQTCKRESNKHSLVIFFLIEC